MAFSLYRAPVSEGKTLLEPVGRCHNNTKQSKQICWWSGQARAGGGANGLTRRLKICRTSDKSITRGPDPTQPVSLLCATKTRHLKVIISFLNYSTSKWYVSSTQQTNACFKWNLIFSTLQKITSTMDMSIYEGQILIIYSVLYISVIL